MGIIRHRLLSRQLHLLLIMNSVNQAQVHNENKLATTAFMAFNEVPTSDLYILCYTVADAVFMASISLCHMATILAGISVYCYLYYFLNQSVSKMSCDIH